MLIQIRKGVFETNSSSTHSITMCTKSDLDDWKSGKLIYDREDEKLIPVDSTNSYYLEWLEKVTNVDIRDSMPRWERYMYLTFDEFFNNYEAMDMDTFCEDYKTPNGEHVVAFGYFSYDN